MPIKANGNDLPKRSIAIDPVTVVVKECILISSSMRKNSKYSQSGVAAILSGGASDLFDDGSDLNKFTITSNGSAGNSTNSDPLLSGFIQLRLMLNNLSNLDEVDSLTLLQPFLLVIKSSSTTGSITSLALDSLSKFLSYGVISKSSKNLVFTLTHIVNSLTHCRFEASEQSSDDAVLLKVLKLLETIIDSDLGDTLSDEVIHEVIQTSLSLACNKRRSEVLRKAAELSMYSITVKIFTKLDHIEPEEEHQHVVEDTHDYSRDELDVHTLGTNEELEAITKKSLELNDTNRPFGLFAIKQFLGILISMISPENQLKHTESTKVFALSLILTATELTAHRFHSFPSLLNLIADPVFKHTLQIIQGNNSLPILQAALQLFTSLALTVGPRLQAQVELTLVTIFNLITPEYQTNNAKSKSGKSTPVEAPQQKSQAAKELIVEEISILWTRSPDLFVNLFINYDANFNRHDLAFNFVSFLSQLSLPESALYSSESVPPICLEGLLSFINNLSDQIKEVKNFEDDYKNQLLADKEKKKEFITATDIFNQKPKDGLKELEQRGFIKSVSDEEDLARFFYEKSSRLNKKVLGEYLAKPANEELLKKFLSLFDFKNLRVDEALRILLKTFRLPGESQQIERIVESFAAHYVANNEHAVKNEDDEIEKVTPDSDAVFVLSYSIIMLNTDLHNPVIKAHMTLEDYKKNLRGVYNGKDFPSWYLEKIFQSIQDKEIVMPEEHHGSSQWFDDSWNNLISANVSLPVQYHSIDEFNRNDLLKFKKYIFQGCFSEIADTVFQIFEIASDDQIITRMMTTIDKLSQISNFFSLNELSDDIVNRLSFNTTLIGQKKYIITNSNNNGPIKFTKIKVEGGETINVSEVSITFGKDFKAQLSTVVLFRIINRSFKSLSSSWENVLNVLLSLVQHGLIEGDILKTFQDSNNLEDLPTVQPEVILTRSAATKGLLSTFASYLKGDEEPSDEDVESTLSALDCIKSANVSFIFDELQTSDNKSLLNTIIQGIPRERTKKNGKYFDAQLYFILELAISLSSKNSEEFARPLLLEIIRIYNNEDLKLSEELKFRLLAYKLILLSKSIQAKELCETFDEMLGYDRTFFETKSSQFTKPLTLILESIEGIDVLANHENFWKVLRSIASIPSHTESILEVTENITKISLSSINPINFMWLLGLLDEISAVGAIGGQWEQEYETLVKTGHKVKKENPHQEIVQISLKSVKFTSSLLDLRPILTKEETYALIQALAHQCLNPCFQIRSFALSNLEQTVLQLKIDENVTAQGVFESGLFPLLNEDIERLDILSLISKVYIHFYKLDQADNQIFLKILDIFNQYLEDPKIEAEMQNLIILKKDMERTTHESTEIQENSQSLSEGQGQVEINDANEVD
ncbi:hypothetical protein WICMUC_001911 [Wickerhamomyces mucosus]|uniref:SEC7 domain-containing protein n=1 Tax=Wickerhamomyces mucosus TaxID=1378264 RepID=A0A9P8PRY0_9ASCO|nr:hypothetical protein WICMUC_001911 [Wickerhamomyces mucosus]